MKTVAYLKTSLDRREIHEQKQVILEFSQKERITVSRFIEMPSSATGRKRIDQLFRQLEPGDTLIVSELSRIGRSAGQIVRTVDALIKGKIFFIAVKEGIWLKRVIQFYEMAPMSLRASLGLAANFRRAAAMLVSPAQRIKPITVLRNAAITCGMLPLRTCERSSSKVTSLTQ